MTTEPQRPPRPRLVRLLVESVAIVASILLAFAIDAGWDERQDRRAETEILEALELEFEDFGARFRQGSDFYREMAGRIVWLLDEAEFIPPEVDRLDRAMLAFVGAPTLDVGSGVHGELVASGRVALISDPVLRGDVSTWRRVLDETTDNEIVIRQYVASVLVPFLASRGAPVGRISRTTRSSLWELSVLPASDAPGRYRELVGDPEFRALAAWRYEWTLGSALSYDRAREAADSVLVRIRTELGR